MKKFWVLLLTLTMALTACAALGDSEGSVVQSSVSIVQSGEYYLVYCFAQIHNNTDNIICLEKGSFDLQSGEQVLSTTDIQELWPYFLNPGEDGYVFDIVSFEPDENGNPVIPQVTGIAYQIEYMTVDPSFASYDLEAISEIITDASGDVSVRCRVTNNTDADAFEPTVAMGLYTESGAMIYADGVTLRDVGIPAGGSVLLRFGVDEAFVNQWKGAGFMPAEARATASFRSDDD